MENQSVKNTIVITSIFPPTHAIKEFAKIPDNQIIVVGDKKSPSNWEYRNIHFISTEKQERMDFALPQTLPYNHYCRKMLGYLNAIDCGADYIIDTDDDNIPNENWTFPSFYGDFDYLPENGGFINIYQLFTKQKIWPRGLPLKLINEDFNLESKITKSTAKIGIWQGLAQEDPDVDAIYRLTDNSPCYFSQRSPVVLGKNTISPFNTQNTKIRKELFPLLYLPTYVTFRFTDILRGLVAQPIMWLYGYHLGFTDATVTQKRNPHDFEKDFISEIPMYLNSESVIETVNKSISGNNTITDNLYEAYLALFKQKVVAKDEIITLEAWLKDIKKLNSSF